MATEAELRQAFTILEERAPTSCWVPRESGAKGTALDLLEGGGRRPQSPSRIRWWPVTVAATIVAALTFTALVVTRVTRGSDPAVAPRPMSSSAPLVSATPQPPSGSCASECPSSGLPVVTFALTVDGRPIPASSLSRVVAGTTVKLSVELGYAGPATQSVTHLYLGIRGADVRFTADGPPRGQVTIIARDARRLRTTIRFSGTWTARPAFGQSVAQLSLFYVIDAQSDLPLIFDLARFEVVNRR